MLERAGKKNGEKRRQTKKCYIDLEADRLKRSGGDKYSLYETDKEMRQTGRPEKKTGGGWLRKRPRKRERERERQGERHRENDGGSW